MPVLVVVEGLPRQLTEEVGMTPRLVTADAGPAQRSTRGGEGLCAAAAAHPTGGGGINVLILYGGVASIAVFPKLLFLGTYILKS